ncbi:MAG: ABC transporter permease, partial [Candidatus Bathyarchaeota archaeon]|nr:ABC transporter permease [Candidatus Bathyarchaeota archaeon]
AQPRLAEGMAMPEWVRIFPQFQDLTTTQRTDLSWDPVLGLKYFEGWGRIIEIYYEAETLQAAQVELRSKFSYTAAPPNEFVTRFRFEAIDVIDAEYSLMISILTPSGDRYLFYKSSTFTEVQGQDVTMDSKDPLFLATLGFEAIENVGHQVFGEKGEYTLVLTIQFQPLSRSATAQIRIQDSTLIIFGHVHGILGVDYVARDIFAQLVYGARLSLTIGLLAAVVGTSIGIFVGVLSGYVGGAVDEISMRVVDILLCLPLLPLLLALVHLYGRNVYYIVLFIAIFGWQGLARVIRSQTLSIRETAFIETARASGAGGGYIMLRHIMPNIIPVAFASMVLAVPSAILFESSLSFLGFGDPRVPTWGKMLQHAFGFGGFVDLAWWWIIPPGLAIIGICLAFVFIGFAFDEIVNPRLRRRR